MAISGLPPKHDDERQRRNAPVYKKVPLKWDGQVRGPELPKDIGVTWCPKAKDWWEKWRRSPQSMVMHETDWEEMLITAVLYNEFWLPKFVRNPSTKKLEQVSKSPAEMKNLAHEIATRLAAYGATYEARLKLRMEIITPLTEAAEKAAIEKDAESAVNYMEMLTKSAATKRGPRKK